MYQAMKRHSLRIILPRLILSLVIAGVLLALTAGSVIKLIAGPQDLNLLGAGARENDYVSVDMSQLMSAYASLSSEDSNQNIKTYYVLRLDNDIYLSLSAPGKYDEKLGRATDQAYDYYRNDSGILNAMGNICGQLKAMDEEDHTMFADWITQSKLPGFETDGAYTGAILALELQLDHVGLLNPAWNWILFALAVACLIWFVAELALVLSGRYHRQVHEALANAPRAAEEWATAEAFGNARIGTHYIWYSCGVKNYVFSIAEIVWVYKQFDAKVTGRYRWPVSIFTKGQAYHELCVQEDAQRETLIQMLRDHGGHFVAGYSQDNYDQYCNDFDAFCARAAADDPNAGAPLIKLPD